MFVLYRTTANSLDNERPSQLKIFSKKSAQDNKSIWRKLFTRHFATLFMHKK